MRRAVLSLVCLLSLCAVLPSRAATGQVKKVLPHLLDLQGRHTRSPSLFDRDAYQAQLRQHPEQRSGIRFDIEWKAKGVQAAPLKLRVELRGVARGDVPKQMNLETDVRPGKWFENWTPLTLQGDEYKKIGEVTAWRVTLWDGERLLSEQKSFLWE
jgi:hypothetical protein